MAASSTTADTVGEETVLLAPTSVGKITPNGPRRWERPWSVQEIHAEAGNWSLAGDAGLLQHLQDFSQNMISRTHQIGKEVDDLVHDAKLMDVRVNNVINDFIMLANNQFVENRVYDEDVSQEQNTKGEKKIQQEKPKEEREAELIAQVGLALKLGVSVIDNAFVKLDPRVVDSDSEEEDNSYVAEPILEAKDPYVTRPLPFLIGTPQFMEDDNVGLVDEVSDEEVYSDQGSISDSEDEKESEESETEYSTSDVSGDEDKKKVAPGKHRTHSRPSAGSGSSDDGSGKDMFAVRSERSSDGAGSGDISASEEEDAEKEKGGSAGSHVRGPNDLAAELAARLGIATPKHAGHKEESNAQNDDLRENSARHKSKDSKKHPEEINKGKRENVAVEGKTERGKHSKRADEDDDIFGQGDGQEDDVLFGKEGGLFSSSKGLFDDEDEGGDLFEDTKKPAAKTEKSKEREGSLFSGDLADEETEEQKILESKPRTKSGRQVPKSAVPVLGAGKDISSLSKPDILGTHTVKKPTAQPAGLSIKGGQGAGGLFDESEEEDDLFSGASKKVDTVQKENKDTSKKKASSLAKKSDLFFDDVDDEEEDDLFGSIAASATKKKKQNNVGVTVEGYDEEGKVEEKKLEDEQLRKKATPEKKLPPGAVSMFGKGPNPIVAALKKQQQAASPEEEENHGWSEEDNNSRSSSLHSISSTTTKAVEATKNFDSSSSSIFVDDAGDDDLFSSKPKFDSKTSAEGESSVGTKSIKSKLSTLDHKKSDSIKTVKDSLFDSISDDEDTDIFGAVARPADSRKPGKDVSLFDGEDKIASAKTVMEAPTNPTSQSANKKRRTLFNDEEEEADEPLFSSKPPQTAGGKDTPKNKTQGLFAQDDLLFGSGQDEDPSVDLFGSKTSQAQSSQKKEASKQPAAIPQKKATPTSKPVATNLFGGDDDDDDDGDLFSVGQLTKSPPATSAIKTVTANSKTESAVTEEVKGEDKLEVKEHKKPAGAVSMFGGIDPSAVLKSRKASSSLDEDKEAAKRDEEQEKKEEKKTPAKIPVSKPKTSVDLFGAEDDDDDDLFVPKAAAATLKEGIATKETVDAAGKETVTIQKPELPKPRKPAGAISVFGSVEPAGLLKEKVLEPKEEKTDIGNDKERSLPPKPAPKPKVKQDDNIKPGDDNIKPKDDNIKPKDDNIAPKDGNITPKSLREKGASLFGGDNDDDSDDLFNVTDKQKTPPRTAPRTPPATASKSSAATPNEALKPERGPLSPDPVRPKILAGAVSMFGGIDPFAGMKKKQLSSEKDEDGESSPQKDKPASLPLIIDPLSALTSSSPVTMATTQTKLASQGILAKAEVHRSPRSPVIDPTTLLPEVTSPDLEKSIEKSGSVDFDHPGETEILSSANKDRPKLNRRRPQSRKARIQAALNTDPGSENVTPAAPTTPTTPTVPSTPATPSGYKPSSLQDLLPNESSASSDVTTKEAPHVNHIRDSPEVMPKPKHHDLFGNDDLLDGLPLSIEESASVGGKSRSNDDDDLFSKDLFGGKSTKLSNGASEDLFSDLSKHEAVASAQSKTTIKSAAGKTIFANEDQSEDLFSDLSRQEAGSKTTVVKSDIGKSILANTDDFEDLFSIPKGKSKVNHLSAVLNQDDLHSATPGQTGSKDKLTTEIEDNDLFASSVKSSSTAKSKLMSGMVKEDDLFSQSKPNSSKGDNSIAAGTDDLVGTKASDDVKKVRSKKAVTKEVNLLSDTTDIFSDIPTSTARESKKKVTKKASEKNAFKGDIDDIFADTSAATIKPKKNIKKKAVQPAVITDNIFDDPLS